MSDQQQHHVSTRLLRRRSRSMTPGSKGEEGSESPDGDAGDLDLGASNRSVSITLAVGVGLMLLVIMLPYIGGG